MLSASANAVASSSTAVQPPVLEDSEFAPLERAGKALSERHNRDDQWTVIGDRVGGQSSCSNTSASRFFGAGREGRRDGTRL